MTGITTHVLDVAEGRPVAGLEVRLDRHTGGEQDGATGAWHHLATAATDADGRVRDWPGAPEAEPGHYRLTFATGAHLGPAAFYPEVTVVFAVADTARHHHVPLLLSPYGYTTYRGT